MLIQKFKIIKLGNALVVTIPALWRRSNGIDRGDLVEIELKENELIVRPIPQTGRAIQNPDFAAGLDTAGERRIDK